MKITIESGSFRDLLLWFYPPDHEDMPTNLLVLLVGLHYVIAAGLTFLGALISSLLLKEIWTLVPIVALTSIPVTRKLLHYRLRKNV